MMCYDYRYVLTYLYTTVQRTDVRFGRRAGIFDHEQLKSILCFKFITDLEDVLSQNAKRQKIRKNTWLVGGLLHCITIK